MIADVAVGFVAVTVDPRRVLPPEGSQTPLAAELVLLLECSQGGVIFDYMLTLIELVESDPTPVADTGLFLLKALLSYLQLFLIPNVVDP